MKALDLASSKQTMTLKEITDLLDVEHNKAMKTVAKMAEITDFGTVEKVATVYNVKGQTIETYKLDKRQSVAVSAKLNTSLLMRVIDRWQELEKSNPKLPVNYIEALTALIESEKGKEIEKRKVAALSTIVDNEFGYSSILRAAKHIGVHENNFNWRPLKNQTLAMGLEVKKVPSPRFEYQNLYPLRAFEFCYPEYDFTELTPQKIIDEVVEI